MNSEFKQEMAELAEILNTPDRIEMRREIRRACLEWKTSLGAVADNPQLVYHYTTAEGIKGILEGQSLWASEGFYLNDSSEMLFGRGTILGVAMRLYSDKEMPWSLWSSVQNAFPRDWTLKSPHYERIFLASFSTEGDDLSQWRAYGGQGGFALGFDRAYLENGCHAGDCKGSPYFKSVAYGKDQVERTTEALFKCLTLASNNLKETHPDKEEDVDDEIRMFLRWAVNLVASFAKDRAFEAEREWRLAIHLRAEHWNQVQNQVQHRVRDGGIIPYFPFGLESVEKAICEIVCGPCREPNLAHEAVASMLRSKNWNQGIKIRNSTIPYRA